MTDTGYQHTDDRLTVLSVRTTHPEHYLLVDQSDGTVWQQSDGHWSRAELTVLVLPRLPGASQPDEPGGEAPSQR